MNRHEHVLLWREPNANRFMRPDWQRFMRHDWERFDTPQGVAEMRARMGLDPRTGRRLPAQAAERKYSPDQPRVPAGNLDGGQWTPDGEASPRVVLADVLISPPSAFDIVPGLQVSRVAAGVVLGRYRGPVLDGDQFTSTTGVVSGTARSNGEGVTLSNGVLGATITTPDGPALGYLITVPSHVDAIVTRDGGDIRIDFQPKV